MSESPLLEGDETVSQQALRRQWRLQRVGWVAMALIVVLALAGVFGPGPLSWSSVTAPDGSIEISYSRFSRNGGPTDLEVTVPASAISGDTVDVFVERDYLDSVELSQITPEPEAQVAGPGGLVFTFEVAEDQPLEVTFSGTGDAIGVRHAGMAVVGHPPVEFWHLFYP